MTDTTVEPAAAIHRGDGELPWVDAGGGSSSNDGETTMGCGSSATGSLREWSSRPTDRAGVCPYAERRLEVRRVSGGQRGRVVPVRAGRSVHTLTVPEDNTEPTDVWFQIHGVNLNLDADGNVESITDGPGVLAAYYALCEAQGLPRPNVVT